MYSLVLMAALTTSTETVAWGHRHGCHGCQGCYASSCGGGYGCHGCYGGGGHGYGCAGWSGCWGGCYGSYYGCYGGWGSYGGCWGCHGAPAMVPAAPPSEMAPVAPEKKSTALEQPARLLVELPADAKLYVDDHVMRTTAGRREFRTPSLARGQTYFYILKAEIVRDGDVVTDTKRILVRAGETATASFGDMSVAISDTKKNRTLSGQVAEAGSR